MSKFKYKEFKSLYAIIITITINFLVNSLFAYITIKSYEVDKYVMVVLLSLSIISTIYTITAVYKIINKFIALKDEKEVFEQVLEALPNALFIHKKLKFTYANTEGAKFFNLTHPDQVIGRPLSDFLKLNLDYIGEDRLNGALSETQFKPLVEHIITKANGDVVEVETFSTPIYVNGKVNVLNILRDITEQKELERLQKKVEEEERKLKEAVEIDRLRNDFFANLSHELRTPLTIIFGAIQLIEKEISQCPNKGELLNKRLKTLKQNCYRLLRLINNLIDMTKIDAGYFSITLKNNDIIPIIEDISLSVVEFAQNKGIAIEFDTEVEEKITACDPDKIERIMLNLLSNAIKFTKSGGTIKINIYDEDTSLKVVVKDNGIGIPEDKLHSIFDRFIQVDKSFTRNHEGSGLGLSIAKSFIHMHGGSIRAESVYGEGTEFIMDFPITLAKEEVEVLDFVATTASHVERVKIEFSDIYS